MRWRNNSDAYGIIAKATHWIIFILVSIMLVMGFLMDNISDKTLRGNTIYLHKLLGLFILFLMLWRLCWALLNVKPSLPLDTPTWQIVAARLVHFSLYALLILMPCVGWVSSVAAGRPPHVGNITFNLPIAPNTHLRDIGFQIHNFLSFCIIAFLALHIFAALYHYFIKKDKILQRMF